MHYRYIAVIFKQVRDPCDNSQFTPVSERDTSSVYIYFSTSVIQTAVGSGANRDVLIVEHHPGPLSKVMNGAFDAYVCVAPE